MNIRDAILELGNRATQMAHFVGDERAVDLLVEDMAKLTPGGQDKATSKNIQLWMHDATFVLRWARCGYPQVVMGHRLGAALMMEPWDVMSEEAPEFPWDAFVVVVPNGLASSMETETGALVSIDSLWIWKEPEPEVEARSKVAPAPTRWWVAVRADGPAMWTFALAGPKDAARLSALPLDVATHGNVRTVACLCRLLLGTCIELAVTADSRPGAPAYQNFVDKKGKGRARPRAWAITLGRHVWDDFRPWVRRVTVPGMAQIAREENGS